MEVRMSRFSREQETSMMETTLTGMMDEQLTEELSKVAQRFRGRQVKITIEEVNDEPKSRGRKS
jgi:hypothetical protein